MKIKNKIKEIENIIKTNKDGFTYKLNTLKPIKNKGFCIAITNLNGAYLKPLIKKVLFISKGFKQIEKNLFIGGWFNSENKKFYLDLTLNLKDEKESLFIGKIFNQIAIFNLNKFKEIKV